MLNAAAQAWSARKSDSASVQQQRVFVAAVGRAAESVCEIDAVNTGFGRRGATRRGRSFYYSFTYTCR